MKLTVLHYPKCGTCRKAVKWLKEKGYELELVDLFEAAPSPLVLADLLQKSGLDIKKFFNTSGEVYKEMNLKDKLPQMSVQDQIDLLSSNGRLVKRPIVTDGTQVTVGFKEEEFTSVWSGQ
ncbi:arsenate reductase family protein [Paenibacillus sp. y28]|uniref:arsenate reductase family protein n=1 Tax=Paenibacillus sp. y28 TaxID=3129110 RepID=UPI003018A588